MKSIILASKSPRRKELLEKIGLKFKTVKSNYKEITRCLAIAPFRCRLHEGTGVVCMKAEMF